MRKPIVLVLLVAMVFCAFAQEKIEFDSVESLEEVYDIDYGAIVSDDIVPSKYSVEEIDGDYALLIEADKNTTAWYSFSKRLRTDVEHVVISYEIKCENIIQEGQQFPNAYVGFAFIDNDFQQKFHVNTYHGSSDWKTEKIDILINEDPDKPVELLKMMIFMSMSGRMEIKNIVVEYFK